MLCATAIEAQEYPQYAVSNIPLEFRLRSSMVIREHNEQFVVKSKSRATLKKVEVTTAFDQSAAGSLLEFTEVSDDMFSVDRLRIELIDANGFLIKRYTRSDFSKQAYGEGLVPDGKIYFLRIPNTKYPITIRQENEIDFIGTLSYPIFEIQGAGTPVEKASFSATVPKELDLRYQIRNTKINNPTIVENGGDKTYAWEFSKLKSFKFEENAPARHDRNPQIVLAPNQFELHGYDGDLTSWKEFGKWYYNLCAKKGELPSETIDYLNKLVAGAKNDKEKAKIIYQKMQESCRYVSIQLGIGGFRPFEASFVEKKKYGDCKALSNYMQASLAAVGVKSHQALINAEYDNLPVDPNFPNNEFNHVILCVPNNKDTVWLECTSKTAEFGRLGNFTENKFALLITDEGGVIAATPKTKASDNIIRTKNVVVFLPDGTGEMSTTVQTAGDYKNDEFGALRKGTEEVKKLYFLQSLRYPEPSEFEFDLTQKDGFGIKAYYEKLHEFAAGPKLFVNTRLQKVWGGPLPDDSARTKEFLFNFPLTKRDSTVYELHPGLKAETIPANKSFNCKYATFKSDYIYDKAANKIYSTMELVLNKHRIPAADFNEVKLFFDKIIEEQNEKIVLLKQ